MHVSPSQLRYEILPDVGAVRLIVGPLSPLEAEYWYRTMKQDTKTVDVDMVPMSDRPGYEVRYCLTGEPVHNDLRQLYRLYVLMVRSCSTLTALPTWLTPHARFVYFASTEARSGRVITVDPHALMVLVLFDGEQAVKHLEVEDIANCRPASHTLPVGALRILYAKSFSVL